jgi:hypothetical protein
MRDLFDEIAGRTGSLHLHHSAPVYCKCVHYHTLCVVEGYQSRMARRRCRSVCVDRTQQSSGPLVLRNPSRADYIKCVGEHPTAKSRSIQPADSGNVFGDQNATVEICHDGAATLGSQVESQVWLCRFGFRHKKIRSPRCEPRVLE